MPADRAELFEHDSEEDGFFSRASSSKFSRTRSKDMSDADRSTEIFYPPTNYSAPTSQALRWNARMVTFIHRLPALNESR
eukprot:768647-Hanusia_phi.AAC.2